MKYIYIIIVISILFLNLSAQNTIDSVFWNYSMKDIATPESSRGMVVLKNDINIGEDDLFMNYKDAFNLQVHDGMNLIKTDTSINPDMQVHRFQQTHKNIPIEGSVIVHTKNGFATKVIGQIVQNMDFNINPAITPETAINNAINFVPADTYIWEVQDTVFCDSTEQIIEIITYEYPDAELVFTLIDNNLQLNSENLILAYKIRIRSSNPYKVYDVYIDSNTGNLIKKVSLILHSNNCHNANPITRYYSRQDINTYKRTIGYLLKDECRGNYIQTFSGPQMNTVTSVFNTWSHITKRVAATAHWSASMTYDYFYTFGRNSIDGDGRRLKIYVDHPECYNPIINHMGAFWDVGSDEGIFCNGDGVNASHHVSLDIVGHEITHGLISHTAELEKGGEETLGLMESFCDIFGKMVEYHNHPYGFTWQVGYDVFILGAIRDMSNPKYYNNFPHGNPYPNTYNSPLWQSCENFDAVTSNYCRASILSYWFYLLTVGGSGTNDHGYQYNVSGIGHDNAAAIAYLTLTGYLNQYSNYPDARKYSIQAAMDIFGVCSNQVIQTIEAWNAVGVTAEYGGVEISHIFNQFCPEPNKAYHAIDNIIISPYSGCTNAAGTYNTFAAGTRIKVSSENLASGQRIISETGSNFHAYIMPCLDGTKMLVTDNNTPPDFNDVSVQENLAPEITEKEQPEIKYNYDFSAFPNPFDNSTTISFSHNQSSRVKIYLTNTYGQEVMQLHNKYTTLGNYEIKIDGNRLQPGVYFCVIETDRGRETIKIVKM
jgi:bacillolysin